MFCENCGFQLTERNEIFCFECGANLVPQNLTEKELENCNGNQRVIIEKYFRDGFEYYAIVELLHRRHGINISLRTLKRRLQQYGLNKGQNVNDEALREVISREIQGIPSRLGYRGMCDYLRCTYGIRAPRHTVMRILKELDPDATERRKSRRLNRRQYHSGGPNDTWHVDGYDKLKPYGLPIHGAVDGFSRKILWLKVCRSNNTPVVPAKYFVESVKEFGFCPNY